MMQKHFGPVWVIAEQTEGKLEPVSLQILGKARELADELGVPCETVLLGEDIGEAARGLISHGADRVYLGRAPRLRMYQPAMYVDIVCSLARRCRPEIILIGSTCMGRELAPMVAARLETGLAAHCTSLGFDEKKNLKQKILAYGGLMSITCPDRRPQMATIARGIFTTPEPDGNRKGEIVPIEVPGSASPPVRTVEIFGTASAGIQLEDANIVVCGGTGACSPGGWDTVRDLAETLGAAMGCTRPAVDESFAPLEVMIGQSGKMVSPQVYIGVGLSGEQQHMVGIAGSAVMVAVNNAPGSPVFQQVDIGVVEDCEEFLPVLVAKIKAYRELSMASPAASSNQDRCS